MEDKLDLIIFQNWLLLGVIGLLLAINIICNWKNIRREYNQPEKEEADRLATLWDKDQIDQLLTESSKVRAEFPNRVDALYFGGKALMKVGQYQEAKELFIKVAEIDFTLKEDVQREIEAIEQETANKASNPTP